MKKVIVLSAALLMCSSAFAESDASFTPITVDANGTAMITDVFVNTVNTVNVRFAVMDDSCKFFESNVEFANPVEINGTWVKLYSQCIDENVKSFFPRSAKGIAFVIDAFKKGKTVQVDTWTVDATGFTAAYKAASKKAGAM